MLKNKINKKIFFLSKKNHVSMGKFWHQISNENHFWFRWRFLILKTILKKHQIYKKNRIKILDIGSGSSIISNQLEKVKPDWAVDIADLDVSSLKKARIKKGKIFLYDINDKLIFLKKKYDVIILFDVLEHVKNSRKFINSALFHLKNNGFAILNVPALQFFYSRYDFAVGHYRRYSPNSLKKEFRNEKIIFCETKFWGLLLVPFLVIRFFISFFYKNKQKIITSGFKSNGIINSIMILLMKLEVFLIRNPLLGSSLMMLIKKKNI